MKTTDIALLFCVAAVFVFGFIIASALDGLANGKKNRLTGKKASHTEKKRKLRKK